MNFDIIKTLCEMINSLTEQQAIYEKDTKEWNSLEQKLVEIECKLFNNLVLMELNETEYLFEQLPILPLLAIHIYKYFNNDQYKDIISILNEQSKLLITLIQKQIYTTYLSQQMN